LLDAPADIKLTIVKGDARRAQSQGLDRGPAAAPTGHQRRFQQDFCERWRVQYLQPGFQIPSPTVGGLSPPQAGSYGPSGMAPTPSPGAPTQVCRAAPTTFDIPPPPPPAPVTPKLPSTASYSGQLLLLVPPHVPSNRKILVIGDSGLQTSRAKTGTSDWSPDLKSNLLQSERTKSHSLEYKRLGGYTLPQLLDVLEKNHNETHGVVVFCWMLNDVWTNSCKIKPAVPHDTLEAMQALVSWLHVHAGRSIMIIGCSAETWKLDELYDTHAVYCRDYFASFPSIKVYDGISAYSSVSHARYHVASCDENKAEMAWFYSTIIIDALG
jgi:hypothetical protein